MNGFKISKKVKNLNIGDKLDFDIINNLNINDIFKLDVNESKKGETLEQLKDQYQKDNQDIQERFED